MDINNTGQAYDAFRVLGIFAKADAHESLFWKFETDGELKMFAYCSDTFHWASADLEEITSDSLPILEQTLKDMLAIDYAATTYFSELYACRQRKMRPMRAVYNTLKLNYDSEIASRLIKLFDACGPERSE